MSIKIQVCKSKSALVNFVPAQYKSKVNSLPDSTNIYTAIVFKGAVATSTNVKKALSKRKKNTVLVFCSENITQEAFMLIEESSSISITLRDFFWSDERYKHIKEFGGIKKTPRQPNS